LEWLLVSLGLVIDVYMPGVIAHLLKKRRAVKKEEVKVEALTAILVKYQVLPKKEEAFIIKAFKDSSVESFEEFLMEEGLVDDINILRALGQYYQLSSYDVVGHLFDHHLLRMFPKSFLLQNALIPLEVDGDTSMVMVASDPTNEDLLSDIGMYVSYDIVFYVGLKRHICDAIKEFYDESLTEISLYDPDEELYQNPENDAHIEDEIHDIEDDFKID